MTNEEKIDFIDFFLSQQEDTLHGQQGKDCTQSRVHLEEIRKAIAKPCVHSYVSVHRGKCLMCGKQLDY